MQRHFFLFSVYYNDTTTIVSISEVSFTLTQLGLIATSTLWTYGPRGIISNDNKQVLSITLSEKFKAGKMYLILW